MIEQNTLIKNGMNVQVTCSFGVADLKGAPPPFVVDLADQALFRAKQSGRIGDCACHWSKSILAMGDRNNASAANEANRWLDANNSIG